MKYNFIEVGSGKFSEYINYATEQTKGITVEPVQAYLDTLPVKPGVQKVFAAVTENSSVNSVDIYSVPAATVDEYGIDPFLKTVHGVGGPHPDHINWSVDYLVEKISVPATTLTKIFQDYQVEGLLQLKVAAPVKNTEILDSFEVWLKTQSNSLYPRKIEVVNESQEKSTQVTEMLSKYQALGYVVHSQTPQKIILTFKP